MPQALLVGITYEEFWESNPRIINSYIKAYQMKLEHIDRCMWTMGMYMMESLQSTIGDELSDLFTKNRRERHKYTDMPYLEKSKANSNSGLTSEEVKEKELRKFLATQDAMRSNFQRHHRKDKGEQNG